MPGIRIAKAAIAMSPARPESARPEDAFGKVPIPWLLMTGTKDASPIGSQTPESRRSVFPALPGSGRMYQLVLPGDRQPRNPNHHRAILAVSTAFWDAYLRDDPAARTWLAGPGPRRVLEKADRWEKK